MSITDELREYALGWDERNRVRRDLRAIADRIDAEHESACAEAYGNGVMSVPIALEENAWVELPKDADGEYIHVGDVMEWPTTGETFEVVGIGEGTLFYVEDGSECADWTGASTKRHHHASTVEGVLEELLREYDRNDSELTNGEIIEMFAKRLTMAEGEDA